jgi:hypothetical protein
MTPPRDRSDQPTERGISGGRLRGGPQPARPGSRRGLALVGLLGGLALIVSGAAIVLILTRPAPVAEGSCRLVAWDAQPAGSELPSGWTISASGFYTDGYGASFAGPAASGAQAATPAMNVRVSCYGTDGHAAIVRSHSSDLALGGTDIPFADIGDEAVATVDASGTTTSVYLRQGQLVASIAAQGMSPDDLEQAAVAIDDAMASAEAKAAAGPPSEPAGGGVGTAPSAPASEEPTPTPTDAHAFTDLEALLPSSVDGTPMSTQSTTASDALSGDPSGNALLQWLTAAGKTPGDLEIAAAYDPTSTVDADFTAFRVKGIAAANLRQAVLESWLGANASGITTTNKTIGGKAVVAIDYGDGGALDYVYQQGDVVVILSSSDAALVERILSVVK